MAWFVFVGDPRNDGEGADEVVRYGYTIRRDVATEVTDAFAVGKLRGNSHYAECTDPNAQGAHTNSISEPEPPTKTHTGEDAAVVVPMQQGAEPQRRKPGRPKKAA